jgi:hypothetical protein
MRPAFADHAFAAVKAILPGACTGQEIVSSLTSRRCGFGKAVYGKRWQSKQIENAD